jgi:hypothetical protein
MVHQTISWYWGQGLNQGPLKKKQNNFYKAKVKHLKMYVTDTHHSDIHSAILWYGDFFIGTEFIDECTIVHRVKCCLIGPTFQEHVFLNLFHSKLFLP